MNGLLTPADFVVFFGSLILVMVVGLWAGRKDDSTEDFYLAGRSTRWWGVAGSIFGTNVSANHIVGMMAVGFSLGFVESHFEITAIAGLLMLCYCLLPVYRKLGVFTLSDYLSQRYDDRSRVAYSLIMITIIVLVMMLPAFYIGSRTVNILLVDQAHIDAVLQTATTAEPQQIQINRTYYIIGVIIMAVVTGTYTIAGGLKAVIVTDVIQSVLMLLAAVIVAFLTFSQPEIGGWANLRAMDSTGKDMFHLHLPSDHPKRPWSGMVTGLMVLHFYYWGANQFIVQRALAAKSDKEARMGIITAGFFKLLIPFISIGTGIAAFYFFSQKMPGVAVDGDTAFPLLLREVVAPVGVAGLVGLVAAGLIGAILSSVDSMMNSAATLITFDIYKRFINPNASDKQLIFFGRACIAAFVIGAALLTIIIFDPNTKEPFFTYVAKHQSRLVAGIVVAFFMGMLWKGATPLGGFASILVGVLVSYTFPNVYVALFSGNEAITGLFGEKLNFFHSVFVAAIFAVLANLIVSRVTTADPSKSKLTWVGLGIFSRESFRYFRLKVFASLAIYAFLGTLMWQSILLPVAAAIVAALWTWLMFLDNVLKMMLKAAGKGRAYSILKEDRFWAGLLAACAIFMLYYFK
jgi:SSS family solute:Na+ symporter